LSSSQAEEIEKHLGDSAWQAVFSDKTGCDSSFYGDEEHLPTLFSSSMADEAYYYGEVLSLLWVDERRAKGFNLSSHEIEYFPL